KGDGAAIIAGRLGGRVPPSVSALSRTAPFEQALAHATTMKSRASRGAPTRPALPCTPPTGEETYMTTAPAAALLEALSAALPAGSLSRDAGDLAEYGRDWTRVYDPA